MIEVVSAAMGREMFPDFWIRNQFRQRRSQGILVSDRDENTGFAVGDDFLMRSNTCGDDREPNGLTDEKSLAVQRVVAIRRGSHRLRRRAICRWMVAPSARN